VYAENIIIARRRICGACPVRQECEDFAVATATVEGKYGGVGGQQRRRHRALRKAA
jgi:hypothetical protein